MVNNIKNQMVFLAICTYGRPKYLKKCIDSILNMEIPEKIDFFLGIIDNNEEQSCKEMVADYEKISTIKLIYAHEPNKGIVHARNKALDCAKELNPDIMGFTDDDCIMSKDWLSNGLEGFKTFNAKILTGPCKFIFPAKTPKFIINARRFEYKQIPSGPSDIISSTRNVLFDFKLITKLKLRFNIQFNLSGGSDTFFFQEAYNAGHKATWLDDFMVHEYVPKSRANLKWVLKRNYRIGFTRSKRVIILNNYNNKKFISQLFITKGPLFILKIFFYLLTFNGKETIRALESLSFLLGKFSTLFKKNHSEYHTLHGE